MGDLLLVIDEGTTSTRAIVFDASGQSIAVAQNPVDSHYPRPGWVEQDPEEIWALTLSAAQAAVTAAGGSERIAAIGITNQRETMVFWDRRSGRALAPAIVWQDRRTADFCDALRAAGHEPTLQARTGLLLDPYFSASKAHWALANWPEVAAAGANLAVGTIDSWLVFRLTGGLHVSDATNASRTMLMDLRGGWDDGLCDLFGVPRAALPEICDSAGRIGETLPELFGRAIPICGIAGDQQSAAIGQACFEPGATKATYGTGSFILTHAGAEPPQSAHRLLGTVAWQLAGERRYALEGSLFVAGSMMQWLRDSVGIIETSAESEALARSVPDSGGVQVVPAFTGLGAPHWNAEARGAILGLSLGSTRAHIVRAALEGIVNQTNELKRAFAGDGVEWSSLRIDGGMAANDFLAQDLADVLGITVERPADVESSALGAAMLAGIGCGLWASLADAAAAVRGEIVRFEPKAGIDQSARTANWDQAVRAVMIAGFGCPPDMLQAAMVPRDGIEPPTP
jgi:glycerol kinase